MHTAMHQATRNAAAVAIFLIAATAHSTGAAAPNGTPSGGAWRCGNSYSDQPCAGGRAVDVDDARSTADRRAQDARTRDTQRQADAMARERRALEAQAAGQRPALIVPPPPPFAKPPPRETHAQKPKTHKPKKHAKGESDAFTASDPATSGGSKKKKKG